MDNNNTSYGGAEGFRRFGSPENAARRKKFYYIFSFASLISLIALLFAPLCEIDIVDENILHKVTAAGCFEALNSENKAVSSFAALQLMALLMIIAVMLISGALMMKMMLTSRTERSMHKQTKRIVILDLVFVAAYTAMTALIAPLNSMLGGLSNVSISIFPLAIVTVSSLGFALLSSAISFSKEKDSDEEGFDSEELDEITQKRRRLFYARTEMYCCAIATALISVMALLSNIVTVNFTSALFNLPSVVISGKDLLLESSTINGEGKQLLGYIVFALFSVTAVLLYLSTVSFITRSASFDKISVSTVGICSAATLAIGLLGKYYDIVQHVNDGMIAEILSGYSTNISLYEYEVVSNSIYFFIASVAIISFIFFRRTYTKIQLLSTEIATLESAKLTYGQRAPRRKPASAAASTVTTAGGIMSAGQNPDPCPAFTVIDGQVEEYDRQLMQRRKAFFADPSLPNLVDFIVQYARDSEQHLFYTRESIAEFIAGLGTTRLSILQGMSGTGKTSLPKIVAEALYSVCDIVEVESSWRDKHELLGYYNEFSKTYTPKKFTEALYRATLNPEVVTFIVLDEMNLSRIEYYFSDFLSLMEHAPDKRELKLLNTPLVRVSEEGEEEYFGLHYGHTIKIPENVWFIGTANRDESTYDISDKVYDRAHTMNFDRRAAKVKYYNDPTEPRYVSVAALNKLFDDAKKKFDFSIEQYPVIAEAEKLLAPYNISFGNRIAKQIESFVKVYTSCFTVNENVIRDGLEIILLSKVVRKLELKNVDDKEALAADFAGLGLSRCSEFILSLKED